VAPATGEGPVDAVAGAACREAIALDEGGRPEPSTHLDRHRGRTARELAHGRRAADGRERAAFDVAPVDLPRREARRAVGEQLEAQRADEELATDAEVDHAREVAVVVERQSPAPALEPAAEPSQLVARRRFSRSLADVEHGEAERRQVGDESHEGSPVAPFVDLGAQGLAMRCDHVDGRGAVPGDPCGDQLAARAGDRIEDGEGRALASRVELARDSAHCFVEDRRERRGGDRLVVPRDAVGIRNARAGEVVVELVPEEALPRTAQRRRRVGRDAQPGGGGRRPLGGRSESLVAGVPTLHRHL
jgi:hypothetical protein